MHDTCAICGQDVPFSLSVHVLIHTNTEAGVVDYDVCRSCYEEQLAPLFDYGAADDGGSPLDESADSEPLPDSE